MMRARLQLGDYSTDTPGDDPRLEEIDTEILQLATQPRTPAIESRLEELFREHWRRMDELVSVPDVPDELRDTRPPTVWG